MTIIGFVTPTGIFGKFFWDNGFNTNSMKRAAKGTVPTLPAAAILADASLTAFTFLTWAKWDSHTHRVRGGWLAFPATYLVGICFGAPLYLLLREYSIDDTKHNTATQEHTAS